VVSPWTIRVLTPSQDALDCVAINLEAAGATVVERDNESIRVLSKRDGIAGTCSAQDLISCDVIQPPHFCDLPLEVCKGTCAPIPAFRIDVENSCARFQDAFCAAQDAMCIDDSVVAVDKDGQCWASGSNCGWPWHLGWEQQHDTTKCPAAEDWPPACER
jgi:hypothetical protein